MTDNINSSEKGQIYLVPTPIGNLSDISERALQVLREVDYVACEDTRHSGQLLAQFGIKKKLISYHDFNEQQRTLQLIDHVLNGSSVAVISDAGTPGISDPAYRLVNEAIQNEIKVIALPGANALLPALTASGLPSDRFFFEGFLSNKSAARKKRLAELAELPHTLVFYESPHRIVKCVTDMHEIFGERQGCIAREISKKFEEYIRGSLGELVKVLEKRKLKGEIVVIVSGKTKDKGKIK